MATIHAILLLTLTHLASATITCEVIQHKSAIPLQGPLLQCSLTLGTTHLLEDSTNHSICIQGIHPPTNQSTRIFLNNDIAQATYQVTKYGVELVLDSALNLGNTSLYNILIPIILDENAQSLSITWKAMKAEAKNMYTILGYCLIAAANTISIDCTNDMLFASMPVIDSSLKMILPEKIKQIGHQKGVCYVYHVNGSKQTIECVALKNSIQFFIKFIEKVNYSSLNGIFPIKCFEEDLIIGSLNLGGKQSKRSLEDEPSTSQLKNIECPMGYYQKEFCEKCPSNCIACANAQTCTQCNDQSTLQSGVCINNIGCAKGQYRDSLGCQLCPINCVDCLNYYHCIECGGSYQLHNRECILNCPSGKYSSTKSVSNICIDCPIHCSRCWGPSECIECSTNYILINGRCSFNCPDGQYGDPLSYDEECLKCSANCNKCFNANTCLSCQDSFILINGACSIKCDDGQYLQKNSYGEYCENCNSLCTLCTSENSCLGCIDGYSLINFQCVITCLEGSYANNNICEPCPNSCTACIGLSNCLQCIAGHHTYNGTCIIDCNIGEYVDISIDTNTCQVCPENCSSCNEINKCLSCSANHHLVQGVCAFNCSDGFYDDINTIEEGCLSCSDNCKTCLDFDICLECSSGYQIYKGKCKIVCPTGQYSTFNNICLYCPFSCSKCISFDECSECSENHTLINGQCKLICSSDEFSTYDVDGEICSKCPVQCHECSDYSHCKSCVSNHYLTKTENNTLCIVKCEENQIGSIYLENDLCLDLPKHCNKAIGIENQAVCLQCLGEFILLNGVCIDYCGSGKFHNPYTFGDCIDCPSFCLECNYISCTQCAEGSILTYGRCLKQCAEGKYAAIYNNESSCIDCPSSCKNCKNSFECVECKTTYVLVMGKCVLDCFAGTFDDVYTEEEICIDCSENCISCYEAYPCLQCADGYSLENGVCNKICLKSQFEKNDLCEDCSEHCISCKRLDVCNDCENGYELIQGICNPICGAGQIWDGKQCSNCSQHCSKCVSTSLCVLCHRYYLLKDSECVSTCPSNYYSYKNSKCMKCSANCKSCVSETKCLECDSIDFDLINGTCQCKKCNTAANGACNVCGGIYFYNHIDSSCKLCENVTTISLATNYHPSSYIYQICTGIFGKYGESFLTYGIGFSGIGNYKNNLCSIGIPKDGVIPPGIYNISSKLCAIKGISSSHIFQLTPLTKFSEDAIHEGLLSSLYIYPISGQNETNFTEGQYGIALPEDVILKINIGDRLVVSEDGCSQYISNCAFYPPPKKGKVSIIDGDKINEFIINFKYWGGRELMDLSTFEYSAAIYIGNTYIELCDEAIIGVDGILCNKDNSLKLGYYIEEDKQFPIRLRVKYSYKGKANGLWAEMTKSILISKLEAEITADVLIATSLSKESFIDCKNGIIARSHALSRIIPEIIAITSEPKCTADSCKNGGNCILIQDRISCTCPFEYAGERCHINKDTMVAAIYYHQEASNAIKQFATLTLNQLLFVGNLILSNTDLISLDTIQTLLTTIETIIDHPNANMFDQADLNNFNTHLLISLFKNVLKLKDTPNRRLSDVPCLCINRTEVVQLFNRINKLFSVYMLSTIQYIIGENLISHNIDNQLKVLHFSSDSKNNSIEGVEFNSLNDSLITAMVYPYSMSSIFPNAINKTINPQIISNIVYMPAYSVSTPHEIIFSKKSLKFFNNSFYQLNRSLSNGTIIHCGYYNGADDKFNSVNCTSSLTEDGDVVCYCSTNYSYLYVIASEAPKKKVVSTKMILGIVIPIIILLVLSPVIVALGMCKVEANNEIIEHKQSNNNTTSPTEKTLEAQINTSTFAKDNTSSIYA